MIGWLVVAAVQAAAPMAGMEQGAEAGCRMQPALPPELAGWTRMTVAMAGAGPAVAAALPIGTGVQARLRPATGLAFAAAPGRTGAPDSFGGLFAFTVRQAGRYRVALGSGAWIDVVAGAMPLPAAAHAPGSPCTGIRKMVDFDLRPGRYLLQLSGASGSAMPLMVARLP